MFAPRSDRPPLLKLYVDVHLGEMLLLLTHFCIEEQLISSIFSQVWENASIGEVCHRITGFLERKEVSRAHALFLDARIKFPDEAILQIEDEEEEEEEEDTRDDTNYDNHCFSRFHTEQQTQDSLKQGGISFNTAGSNNVLKM